VDDTTIWRESNNVLFTLHSAWNIIRNKRSSNIATSKIWNCAIPFKMCFLTWRDIYNRLSTEDQVAKLGINIEPGCYCCVNIPDNNSLETADHLFCKGNLAKNIWRSIANSLGVRLIQNSLKLLLLNWWNTHTNNPIASFIIQALPPIICWEIWKTRCANKFENVKPSPYRTNVNILFTLLQITRRKFGKANIGETWRSLSNIFYANIHQHISNPVKWIKPPARTFKLNNDGSWLAAFKVLAEEED